LSSISTSNITAGWWSEQTLLSHWTNDRSLRQLSSLVNYITDHSTSRVRWNKYAQTSSWLECQKELIHAH